MAHLVTERSRPLAWAEYKKRLPKYLRPCCAVGWVVEWAAYWLGRWPVIELLEYLGSFSILFAAIAYFVGAPARLKQMHFQAWQVINSAQGKGGNGGRLDALQELNHDHVSLTGVDVSGAYLQGLRLEEAQARRANLAEADLRDADFQRANLPDVDLHYANLRGANLRACDFSGSNLEDADLTGADLTGANLCGVTLDRADLRSANLEGVENWQAIKSIDKANILGARNAPKGFVEWAEQRGAVENGTEPN